MSRKISDKDKKDWEDFLTDNNTLDDKDANSNIRKTNKIISYDLHGYSLDEANRKIKDLIINAYNQSINKLIIVTGKGIHSQNKKDPYVSKDLSILKYSVPEYIENNPALMKKIINITDANIEDGGSGAFYIYLKKNQ